jgi:hypothetical protein
MATQTRPLTQEERLRRRSEAKRRIHRRRRIAAAGLAAAALGVTGTAFALMAGGGGGEDGNRERARPAAPAELPRGGRSVFPEHRVVAYYGAPQDDELGALGIGSPARMARRLERQAAAYRRGRRTILPAFELISTLADGHPGDDGSYSTRQRHSVIRRYLAAARRAKALLILDIQPGREDFMTEVRRLRPFLEEPDVSLALDPEWHVGPGQVPGQEIGSMTASEVNRVSAFLSDIVRRANLPEKLLLVHQFTPGMIQNRARMRRRVPGVEVTVNVDGFGDRPNKIAKYRQFTRTRRRDPNGIKLFYKEDTNLLAPRSVLRLRPRPDLVVYE